MSIKTLRNFASYLVGMYAKMKHGQYDLFLKDIPDIERHEFAALIMLEDLSKASEATSADNMHWENKMLPALLNYLKNSTDPDEAIEFRNTWKECVTSYFDDEMQEYINDALHEYNSEHGLIESANKSYGVSQHAYL